jgi:hypothetical protein
MHSLLRIFAAATTVLATALQLASAAEISSINFDNQLLEGFRDCSIRLWYDPKNRTIVGEKSLISVPQKAIIKIKEHRATLAINGTFYGIPVTQLIIPTVPIDENTGSDQIIIKVTSNIEKLKNTLQSAWSKDFTPGTPDGMDPDPNAITYYSKEIAFNPSLNSASRHHPVSWLYCPIRPHR